MFVRITTFMQSPLITIPQFSVELFQFISDGLQSHVWLLLVCCLFIYVQFQTTKTVCTSFPRIYLGYYKPLYVVFVSNTFPMVVK